jgi:hypothetical protein
VKHLDAGFNPYETAERALDILVLITSVVSVCLFIPALLGFERGKPYDPIGLVLVIVFIGAPLTAYTVLCWLYVLGRKATSFLQPFVTWASVLCLLFGVGQAFRLRPIDGVGMDLEMWALIAGFAGALLVCGIAAIVIASGYLEDLRERWIAAREP